MHSKNINVDKEETHLEKLKIENKQLCEKVNVLNSQVKDLDSKIIILTEDKTY